VTRLRPDPVGLGTVVVREHSRAAEGDDDPRYPVATSTDRQVLRRHREVAAAEEGVLFGGWLGTCQLLEMHMAVASALHLYDDVLRPHPTIGAPLRRAAAA
jgi:UDP-galactopyranose mutase